jgi:hypothetical protein
MADSRIEEQMRVLVRMARRKEFLNMVSYFAMYRALKLITVNWARIEANWRDSKLTIHQLLVGNVGVRGLVELNLEFLVARECGLQCPCPRRP